MCIGILKLKLILFVQCLLSNLLIIAKIDIPNENLSFLLSLTRAPSCRIYYQAVHVQFIPERAKTSNGTYTRALVDSEQLEWIELSPDTKDQDPSGGGGSGENQEENPLG